LAGTGLLGVLPMCVLTRDGRTHEQVAMVLSKLKGRKDLLTLALTLVSMVYTSSNDLDWLMKEVKMMEDMISDTWFYQHILEKGEVKGREEGRLEGSWQAVINIIQARFPEMTPQAQKVVRQATDFKRLQQLITDISVARDTAEVARLLSALSNDVQA
jgi:predicted transposase YdaD